MDKRCAASYLQDAHDLSERRACALVGIARTTHRYHPKMSKGETDLTRVIREYAEQYPHYGYRLITALLQTNGIDVNHKRIERICDGKDFSNRSERHTNGDMV